MKHKICITIDEETLLLIREKIRKGIFRNRSHAFEFSVMEQINQTDKNQQSFPKKEE
jgi:Arc/MetJ-type ribon-helix-helix transcriptional regulator